MSKRSRAFFESLDELENLISPPKKRQKLDPNETYEKTPEALIKKDDILSSPKQSNPSKPKSTRTITGIFSDFNKKPPKISQSLSPNKKGQKLSPPILPSNKLFFNQTFFLLQLPSRNKTDFNDKRIKLFKSIIVNNGGKITNDETKANLIICSDRIAEYDIERTIHKKKNEWMHYTFVNPEYITTTIRFQKKQNANLFKPQYFVNNNNEKKKKQKMENLNDNKDNKNNQNNQNNNNNNNVKKYKNKIWEDKDIFNDDIFNDNKNDNQNNNNYDQNDQNDQNDNNDDKKQHWVDQNRENFACQIKNSGNRPNYNYKITEILGEMEKIYHCLGDKWREYSYKKANGIIKKYPKKIENSDIAKLMKMKGFSKKLGTKIEEILKTGQLKKLNELKSKPMIVTLELFTNIWGVGHATAQQWYNAGFRTLDDIRQKCKLNERQKIGLKYYNDLLIKIPRYEIKEIEKFLFNEIETLCPNSKKIICGSYRRGKPSSGDIDVLITHKNCDKLIGLLHKLIKHLISIHFLVDHLALPSNKHCLTNNNDSNNNIDNDNDNDIHDTYMGICKLLDPKYTVFRHIDIKVYRPEHFPFAILYFTGSDHFNRSMRYFAKKKGYTLSDTMLAPAIRINNQKIHTGKAIPCYTEQDIFKALGLNYVKPTERNTYENFGAAFNHDNDQNMDDDNKDDGMHNNNNNNNNAYSQTP